jgi:hypothetical protein
MNKLMRLKVRRKIIIIIIITTTTTITIVMLQKIHRHTKKTQRFF